MDGFESRKGVVIYSSSSTDVGARSFGLFRYSTFCFCFPCLFFLCFGKLSLTHNNNKRCIQSTKTKKVLICVVNVEKKKIMVLRSCPGPSLHPYSTSLQPNGSVEKRKIVQKNKME